MIYKYLNDPCRNFCILASMALVDPVDGYEKFVLSSFVDGGTGILVFIDRITGEGEVVALPGDEGAWALLNVNNEKLLVGTCGLYGYRHKLDLKTRTWAEPLRDESETYIWNLVMGSDGRVYGGTWPGGFSW
jgi:Gluconolactonase